MSLFYRANGVVSGTACASYACLKPQNTLYHPPSLLQLLRATSGVFQECYTRSLACHCPSPVSFVLFPAAMQAFFLCWGKNHPNLRLESREASLSKYSPVLLWGSHISELQQKLTDFEFGIQHTLPCLVPGNAFVVQSVSTAAEILGFPNVKLVPLTRN